MVTIRSATVADAPLLWKAEVETARSAGRLVSRPHELLLEAFEAKVGELGPRGCYLVAVDKEEICGHAFLEPMSLEAVQHVYRLTIVVHPGARVAESEPRFSPICNGGSLPLPT